MRLFLACAVDEVRGTGGAHYRSKEVEERYREQADHRPTEHEARPDAYRGKFGGIGAVRQPYQILQVSPHQPGIDEKEDEHRPDARQEQQTCHRQRKQIGNQRPRQRSQRAAQFLAEADLASCRGGLRIILPLDRAHDILGEKLQHEKRYDAEQEPAGDQGDENRRQRAKAPKRTVAQRRRKREIDTRSAGCEDRQRQHCRLAENPENRRVAELAESKGKGAGKRQHRCAGMRAVRGRVNADLGLRPLNR